MSYLDYVVAAYLVFAGVMAWEWLGPRLQIRRALRAARQRARQEQFRCATPAITLLELKR